MRTAGLALLMLFEGTASAATWRLAVETPHPEFGRTMAFVDTDSVQRAGSRIRMRIDLRIERPPGNADGIRSLLSADCNEHWVEVSEGSYFSGGQALGPTRAEPRSLAEPGTNYRRLLDQACAGSYLSGSVDPVETVRRAWSSQ